MQITHRVDVVPLGRPSHAPLVASPKPQAMGEALSKVKQNWGIVLDI